MRFPWESGEHRRCGIPRASAGPRKTSEDASAHIATGGGLRLTWGSSGCDDGTGRAGSIDRERPAHAYRALATDGDGAGRLVDGHRYAPVPAHFAALAGDVAAAVARHVAGVVQQGADGRIGASGDRVFRDA